MELLDLRAMRCEVRHIAWSSNAASLPRFDGIPDGFHTDCCVEVELPVAEGGAVDVVLRPLDGELDSMAMAAHQDELDYLVCPLRLADKVARADSDPGQFPEHVAEVVLDAVQCLAIDCNQVYVRIGGMHGGTDDVLHQAAEYVDIR